MNLMSYLQIKIRLLIMNIRLQTAKKRVLLSVKNSRKTTDKMDYEYSRFLSLAEKREELDLQLIYVTNAQTTRPMLDTSFDTGIINVSKQAEETISDFDRTLALVHHRHGDWGDISAWDRTENNKSLQSGCGTVCSKYRLTGGKTFRIETDLEKRQTQIRLEDEYQ